eukprot:gene10901-7559_t
MVLFWDSPSFSVKLIEYSKIQTKIKLSLFFFLWLLSRRAECFFCLPSFPSMILCIVLFSLFPFYYYSRENILFLLNKSRFDGGFGGHINFSGFSALAKSFGVNDDDIDYCWYNALNGDPKGEVENTSLLADLICQYIPNDGGQPREKNDSLQCDVSVSEESFDIFHVPSSRASFNQFQYSTRENNGKFSCPDHRPFRALSRVDRTSTTSTSNKQKRDTILRSNRGVETTKAKSNSLSIFDRLYEEAQVHNNERKRKKEAFDAKIIADCSFKPATHSIKGKSDVKNRSKRFLEETASFKSRLTGTENHFDPIDDAPETPRVPSHPPPGPATHIPHGYFQEIARLRSRSNLRSCEFFNSLREYGAVAESSAMNLQHKPILRLPITVNGERKTIDLCLQKTFSRYLRRKQHKTKQSNAVIPLNCCMNQYQIQNRK